MVQQDSKSNIELIRIMGTDIGGNDNLLYGLAKVKGIGIMFSNALCEVLKLEKTRKISTLEDKEVEKIESYLENPQKEGIPKWLLNQRKEIQTGDDLHFVSKDIDYSLLQFKRRIAKTKSYKGQRLRYKLTVRGQRTRSNFRKNKTIASKKAKKGGIRN